MIGCNHDYFLLYYFIMENVWVSLLEFFERCWSKFAQRFTQPTADNEQDAKQIAEYG